MLDEPTSGLDSFTANEVRGACVQGGLFLCQLALPHTLRGHKRPHVTRVRTDWPPPHTSLAQVMTVVKSLACDQDVTIVATIHSPTAATFALFDR